MKVVPLDDKVVIKRLDAEAMTAGGILLPMQRGRNRSRDVFYRWVTGGCFLQEPGPSPGQRGRPRSLSAPGRPEVEINGQDLLILKEDEILAIVKDSSGEIGHCVASSSPAKKLAEVILRPAGHRRRPPRGRRPSRPGRLADTLSGRRAPCIHSRRRWKRRSSWPKAESRLRPPCVHGARRPKFARRPRPRGRVRCRRGSAPSRWVRHDEAVAGCLEFAHVKTLGWSIPRDCIR